MGQLKGRTLGDWPESLGLSLRDDARRRLYRRNYAAALKPASAVRMEPAGGREWFHLAGPKNRSNKDEPPAVTALAR